MSNVFLFTARITNQSMSGIVAKEVAPRPPASVSPFALTPAEWSNLRQLVASVSGLRAQAQGLISPEPCASAILQRTWLALAEQTNNWTTTLMPGLRSLAADIISYARDVVPVRYGALKALLDAAGDRALTSTEAQQCQANMAQAMAEANARAARAEAMTQPVETFVSAITDFRTAFNNLPRNPPVNVVLPDIPYICLSYGGDSLACAGDLRRADPKQQWVVEFERSAPDVWADSERQKWRPIQINQFGLNGCTISGFCLLEHTSGMFAYVDAPFQFSPLQGAGDRLLSLAHKAGLPMPSGLAVFQATTDPFRSVY